MVLAAVLICLVALTFGKPDAVFDFYSGRVSVNGALSVRQQCKPLVSMCLRIFL